VSHPLTWLDVFSAQPLVGNGLAVVHEADDLDETTMLAVARETRLSETTFVQSATRDGADYRNRIFTMQAELPFAGHPSLGTAVAVAHAAGTERGRYVQQTEAGLQLVEVEGSGQHWRASMLQEPVRFGDEIDPARALAPVGLDPDDADPALPPQVVSTGLAHLMVPVRGAGALARVRPGRAAVEALVGELEVVVLYYAACDVPGGTAQARGFFVVPAGVAEDPATGSAAGPLCAYLAERSGLDRLVVEQGVEMGRASRMEARLDVDRVRVGGDVIVVLEGRLLI